jgi:hypothetical protein
MTDEPKMKSVSELHGSNFEDGFGSFSQAANNRRLG